MSNKSHWCCMFVAAADVLPALLPPTDSAALLTQAQSLRSIRAADLTPRAAAIMIQVRDQSSLHILWAMVARPSVTMVAVVVEMVTCTRVFLFAAMDQCAYRRRLARGIVQQAVLATYGRVWDYSMGVEYYYHLRTGATQWTKPLARVMGAVEIPYTTT